LFAYYYYLFIDVWWFIDNLMFIKIGSNYCWIKYLTITRKKKVIEITFNYQNYNQNNY